MAHAFVTGGVGSESERDISVGGVSAVPPTVFAGVDYTALGHLHGRQEVAEGVRYSGSPVAMSFSEWAHRKGSLLVDLSGAAPVVERVEAPVERPLAVLRGTLDQLLTDPAHRGAEAAWCQVTLTDPQRPLGAMDQVRRRFPFTLELRFDPQGATVPLRPYVGPGRHRHRRRGLLRLPRPRARRPRGQRRRAGAARRGRRGQPGRPPGRRRRGRRRRVRRRRRVGGRGVRVHRLEIEAFGPFPGRVVVDVDALSAEGLFLIHGPTGSGKTSLLDAICFALYADVPGSRSKRGLRSDHAGPDAVPRVTLELTAGTRRLRLTRSPEFARPKKRGNGTVSVQAMVTLEERLDGRWVALSSRNDEVADVVKDALGMGMAQFAKVVLLPQGDFAAFLRATPDDRREVLERLFDISAFSDVEAWLAQARRTAGADLEVARSALASVVARADDVLAQAGSAGDTPPLPPESVAAHLHEVAYRLDARVSTTMAAFDAASGAERVAAETLAAARVLHEQRTRGLRALARLEALAAAEHGHRERVAG